MKDEKWLKDEEYLSYVKDLLKTDLVQQLAEFIQHRHYNRLEHSVNVSYTSFKLAKKWKKFNARAVARAGLLHDLFLYDWREQKDLKSHAYIHPRIAVCNAEKITELSDLEKDIILKHMWGATLALPRYKESFLVSFVDKYWAVKELIYPLRLKWINRRILRRKDKEKVSV